MKDKVFDFIEQEKQRQMNGIELIPSECLASKDVLRAMGSVPNNKYSEGYPGKRYYGGNEIIDKIENLAINRLKSLFNAEHANVQPLSGSPANMAVYYALMDIGDTFMGMKLTEGGHLSHGHPVNFSGKVYNCVQYGVDKETEVLDYDKILKQAKEVEPEILLSGYTAYPREIDFKEFRKIADEVGAVCMADISHIAGLCATDVHENPVPYFDVVTTTTHKTLQGPRSAVIMCKDEYAEKIDRAVFPGLQGGPHEHTIAAKAVAFKEASQPEFKDFSKQIIKNSKAMADELLTCGLRLVSGGTDTHLILVDTMNVDVPGKKAEKALEEAGIYCNKNTIPFDKRSPFDPSGIRIGTPVITRRGMKENEARYIARLMDKVIRNHENETVKKNVKEDVLELCSNFPFY